jgi:hypothetical protein
MKDVETNGLAVAKHVRGEIYEVVAAGDHQTPNSSKSGLLVILSSPTSLKRLTGVAFFTSSAKSGRKAASLRPSSQPA